MAPKGLKKALKDTAPCKLVGSGEHKRFETRIEGAGRGVALKGVTKRLQSHIFSDGYMPHAARASDPPAGGHWKGPGGGRRRGSAERERAAGARKSGGVPPSPPQAGRPQAARLRNGWMAASGTMRRAFVTSVAQLP